MLPIVPTNVLSVSNTQIPLVLCLHPSLFSLRTPCSSRTRLGTISQRDLIFRSWPLPMLLSTSKVFHAYLPFLTNSYSNHFLFQTCYDSPIGSTSLCSICIQFLFLFHHFSCCVLLVILFDSRVYSP